jgi:hypothetical protein
VTGPEQVGACILAAIAVLLAAHDLRHGRRRNLSPAEQRDLQTRLAASEKKNDDIAIDYCDLKQDYEAAVAEIRRLQECVIRQAADKERLRQAVVNARPRITRVAAPADEPLSPAGVLPLTVPSQQKEVA